MKVLATWITPLEGHQFDLEDLSHWFRGQGVHVAKRSDQFVLVVPVVVVGDSYEPVRAFAEGQVELINGIGRLLSEQFRPVTLTDKLYGLDAAEDIIHTVMAVAGTEVRMKGGAVGLKSGGDPRDGAAAPLIAAAFASGKRRDALVIVGRPQI